MFIKLHCIVRNSEGALTNIFYTSTRIKPFVRYHEVYYSVLFKFDIPLVKDDYNKNSNSKRVIINLIG